jgi:hypothetical protein
MMSTYQLTIETVASLFFLVVAITCLLWPDKFYEHALRRQYRKADLSEETDQNLQRRGYVWTVRVMGLVAAIMFTFIVTHLSSSRSIGHQGAKTPVPIVPKEVK